MYIYIYFFIFYILQQFNMFINHIGKKLYHENFANIEISWTMYIVKMSILYTMNVFCV